MPVLSADQFPKEPCEGFFQVNFPDEYYIVASELLVKSRLLQPIVELAQLDDSEPIEVRNQITLSINCSSEFNQMLMLISRLMDEPNYRYYDTMTGNELAQLLRLSDHFQFTELTEQLLVVLAERVEGGAAVGKLCEVLSVPRDMTDEQKAEAERNCNIFRELDEF